MELSRRKLLGAATLIPFALAAPAVLRFGSVAMAQEAATVATSKPMVMRRKIGDIEVFALLDGYGSFPNAMFPEFEEGVAAAAADAAHKPFDPSQFTLGINAYLIRTKDRVIAVDTGAPAAMGPTVGGWSRALANAGITPEQVDTVFLTHIHADHVGGLTDPSNGTKNLPAAKLVVAETEWAFAHDDDAYAAMPADFKPLVDISRAMVAPYDGVKTLIQPGAEVAPGLTTLSLPGHTPGQLGLRVDSGKESLLIWGDVIHGPAFQFTRPDWSFALDYDLTQAAETRQSILDMAATDGLIVAGMHLDFPGFGYVETAREGYRFIAAPYDFRE